MKEVTQVVLHPGSSGVFSVGHPCKRQTASLVRMIQFLLKHAFKGNAIHPLVVKSRKTKKKAMQGREEREGGKEGGREGGRVGRTDTAL